MIIKTSKENIEKASDLPINIRRSDLPYDLAVAAHSGTSMSPEKRAEREQNDYLIAIKTTYGNVKDYAKTPAQKKVLVEELERYRQKWLEQYKNILRRRSSMFSTFIAGPANYPARQQQKKNDAHHNALGKFYEWQEEASHSIIRKINDALTAEEKIQDQSDRIKTRLEEKILTLIRRLKDGEGTSTGKTNLVGLLKRTASNGHIKEVAEALEFLKEKQSIFKKPVFTERHSIWNSAKEAKERPELAIETGELVLGEYAGARIVDNKDAERVQIYFDEKPGYEVLKDLKGSGWHWSPSRGVWQRKNTNAARYSAISIVSRHFKREQ